MRDALAELVAHPVHLPLQSIDAFVRSVDALIRTVDACSRSANLVADVDQHLQRHVVLGIHDSLHSTEWSCRTNKQPRCPRNWSKTHGLSYDVRPKLGPSV